MSTPLAAIRRPCTRCKGTAPLAGRMGNRLHYRCSCGHEFARTLAQVQRIVTAEAERLQKRFGDGLHL
jgi:hypothetical protein